MGETQLNYRYDDLSVEIGAAITAALAISPIIMIVDRSVMLSANGKTRLAAAILQGLKSILNPVKILLSFQFRWIFFVYVLTYTTSNVSHIIFAQIQFINPSTIKLIATFLINTSTSMIKDKKLAQKLGKSSSKPFPLLCLALFFLRDIIAMASAFTIPPILAQKIISNSHVDIQSALKAAQILSPMMVQFLTTFIQLLALDLYNRQNQSLVSRFQQVKKNYLSSLFVRIIGFTSAYGLGGIINFQMKNHLNEQINSIQL